MPTTRAQKKTNSEGGDKGSSARQRNVARAKSKDSGVQGQTAADSDNHDTNDEVYFDDEEPDIGKTLHAKDGKLGFITSKGFVCATNFLVDIASQVHSQNYSMKGYEVIVKKAGSESWENFA